VTKVTIALAVRHARASCSAAVSFSARKSKQSSVFVAFFHDMACIYCFSCFNVGGGERTKDILCIFPNYLIPFLLGKKILIITYLKDHKHTILIMEIIYFIFENCDR